MLIGITDIAKRMDVDRTTVFRWVQLGKITAAQKMSGDTGALLFEPDEVERFIAAREAEQAASA